MALDNVLANIPGLGGYLAMEQYKQRQALGGLQGALGVLNAVEQGKQRELQQEMLRMQVQKAQREQQFQQGLLGMLSSVGGAGSQQLTPGGQAAPGAPGRLNQAALALSLSGLSGGPTAGKMLQDATDPGKIVWRDDGERLVPVYENTGRPAAGVDPISKAMTPGERANFTERQRQFNTPSATEAANLAIRGAELQYNTGQAVPVPGAPTAPSVGQRVTLAPDAAEAERIARAQYAAGQRNIAVTTDPARVPQSAPGPASTLPPAQQAIATREGIESANRDFVEKSYRPTMEAAQGARQGNAVIEAYRSIPLSSRTGWGTQAIATASNVLTGLGIAPEQAKQLASDAQMFNKLAMEQNWQMLVEQKGVQTEGDAQRARQVFAQLGNTPDANEFIWDFTKAMNDVKIAKAKFFAEKYGPARQRGDMASIEADWAEKNKDWSLFDHPAMKRWKDRAGAAPASSSGPIRVQTEAEYNALPSGARYIHPDGSTRTKR